MFPYYEDMDDFEVVTTNARRIGAMEMGKRMLEDICVWIENNYHEFFSGPFCGAAKEITDKLRKIYE